MKKTVFLLLICSLVSILLLSSCNVDATDGLADQVRNSAQASGIRILQLLHVSSSGEMIVRSDKGIYTISDGTLSANKLSNSIKAAYSNGTKVYFLDQQGKLYKYELSNPSATPESVDAITYSYLDEKGFLLNNGSVSNIGQDVSDNHVYSTIFTSGTSYVGQIYGATDYSFNNSDSIAALSSKTVKAIVETETGTSALIATDDKKVYSTDDFSTVYATLSNAPSGPACKYGEYAIFKTANSFECINISTKEVISMTTKWATSIRNVEVSGFAVEGTDLYVATTNNGIWKISSIDANEAHQIFH